MNDTIPPVNPAPTTPTSSGSKQSSFAIGSLVCGILAIFFWFITGIPAIILGHKARKEIKNNPSLQGNGMAVIGLILGYLFTILSLFFMIGIALLFSALAPFVKDIWQTGKQAIQVQQDVVKEMENIQKAVEKEAAESQPAAPAVKPSEESTSEAASTHEESNSEETVVTPEEKASEEDSSNKTEEATTSEESPSEDQPKEAVAP